MKKRLASIALALTLSIGMMPTAVWAYDDGISVQNNDGIAVQASIDVSRIMGTDNDGKAISDTLTITGSNLDGYYITADKTTWNINNGKLKVM